MNRPISRERSGTRVEGEHDPAAAANGKRKNGGAQHGRKMGALAASAGAGTLLVVLAQNLPDRAIKSWLVLLAPTASAGLSWIWSSLSELIEIHIREREKRQLFARVRHTILESMDDPHISAEYKESLQKQLEELEMLKVSGLYKRIKLLESA